MFGCTSDKHQLFGPNAGHSETDAAHSLHGHFDDVSAGEPWLWVKGCLKAMTYGLSALGSGCIPNILEPPKDLQGCSRYIYGLLGFGIWSTYSSGPKTVSKKMRTTPQMLMHETILHAYQGSSGAIFQIQMQMSGVIFQLCFHTWYDVWWLPSIRFRVSIINYSHEITSSI